jgi:hypothetical protein
VKVSTVSVADLRKKLSAASGGAIPALAGYSANEVVKKYAAKIHNRSSAIRAKCIECCCGGVAEVAACRIEKCALHPFRMGKDPFNKKTQAAMAGEEDESVEEDEPTQEPEAGE